MNFKLVLDCSKNLENKIKYIFDTFQKFLCNTKDDFPLSFVYTNDLEKGKTSDIHIYKDPYAEDFFSRKIEYPVERVKYYEWNGEKIPFLFYSDKGDNKLVRIFENPFHIEIKADIFASAFYFLSLWQEYTSVKRDIHDRFSAEWSIQKKLGILRYPIVNVYFNILMEILVKHFKIGRAKGGRFNGKSFAIGLSHDIDYIKKWSPGIIYREIVKFFLFNERNLVFSERLERFQSFCKAFFQKHDPYKVSVQKIIEIEKKNKILSTFFFKAGGNSKHDVSYSLKNKFIINLISELSKSGFDIGLHPSYNAFNNIEMIGEEKERLYKAVNVNPESVRQHFLRYDITQTSKIQDQLKFLFDSTLGFHDHEGFRASYCLPYQIYDIINDRKLNIWEVPLIMMDATLTDYRKLDNIKSLEKIKELIMILKKFNGVGVFLFHNTSYDDFDFNGWGEIFEETIKFASEEGAFLGSLREIISLATN